MESPSPSERGQGEDLCPVPDEPTPEGGGSAAGRAACHGWLVQ